MVRDIRDARMGKLHQVSGTKRWRGDEDGQIVNSGSFSLDLYNRLTPMLADSWRKLGLLSKEVSESMTANRVENTPRRNPRRYLVHEGAPDLSTIGDATEPDASREAIMLPSTAETTSPLKRKARLELHLESAQELFRSKMVRVDPVSSAADSTSPIKPSSPTTPGERHTLTGEHEVTSVGRAFGAQLLPSSGRKADSLAGSPTKTFMAPSPSSVTAALDAEHTEHEIQAMKSPVRRPGAPTPSRWRRPDPTTPMTAAASLPATPSMDTPGRDGQQLVDSIPRSVDRPIATPTHWDRQPQSFQFGSQMSSATPNLGQSPMIFMSPMGSIQGSEHQRARRVVEGRRRKSEPLVQKHLKKMQRTRRQTVSPSKLFPVVEENPFDNSAQNLTWTPGRQAHDASNAETPVFGQGTQAEGSPAVATDGKGDVTAPLPSSFKNRPGMLERRDPTTPFHDRNVYDIDVRQNLNIFGAVSPTRVTRRAAGKTLETKAGISNEENDAVQQLLSMVEDRCDGHAKVVVKEENGKLVVRFKLPIQYATLFPESQGHDESRFTSTPSAISSSPRINFRGHRASPSAAAQNPSPLASVSLKSASPTKPVATATTPRRGVDDTTLQSLTTIQPSSATKETANTAGLFDAVERSFKRSATSKKLVHDSPVISRISTRDRGVFSPATPHFAQAEDRDDKTLIVEDFDIAANQILPTPVGAMASEVNSYATSRLNGPSTPIDEKAQEEELHPEAPSSGLISDLSFEPTFQTPTHGHLNFSPQQAPHTSTSPSTRQQTLPMETENATQDESPKTPIDDNARATPQLTRSFTPVNKRSPVGRQTTSPPDTGAVDDNNHHTPTTNPIDDSHALKKGDTSATRPKHHQQQEDSPGREFMRAFIKRSTKPKRPSTTDMGSPIAHSPARLPLGAKSPNMGSDSAEKAKRKRDIDEDKVKEEQVAKKPRRGAKAARPQVAIQREAKLSDGSPIPKSQSSPSKTAKQGATDDGTVDSNVRRSSRLNTADQKSALPTAIKLNRSGAGKDSRPLNSAVRNEQAELTRQTNINTRKNKFKAESVHQVLARVSSDASSEEDVEETEKRPKGPKNVKTVAWKDPIESHQVEKPKRGRPPAQKKVAAAATIEKQAPKEAPKAAPKAAAKSVPKPTPKSRIAKPAAQSLGMTSNGTPAKRMTRSRARNNA